MNEDFGAGLMLGAIAGAVVILVAFIVFTPNYGDGYCAALGGTAITVDTCNVHGFVVEVK